MAEDEETQADPETGEEDAEEQVKGKSKKKKLLVLGLGAVLLLGGGGAGAYFTGLLGSQKTLSPEEMAEAGQTEKARAQAKETFFHALEDIVVDIAVERGKKQYLKVGLNIEVEDEDTIAELEKLQPRIVSILNIYLRELRDEDLKGSASIIRLKNELRRRIGIAVSPYDIRDVHFSRILLQ